MKGQPMKRLLHLSRLLVVTFAILALAPVAACSGGGGDDDDDDSIEPTHCQILWSDDGANQDRYDVYVVDMPIGDWITGTKTYTLDVADEIVGIYYDEYLFDVTPEWAARAINTSGTFDVTVTSTSQGSLVQLTDDGNQTYFDLDDNEETGYPLLTGGAATFDGVWSDPDPEVVPDPGTGTVALAVVNSSGTVALDSPLGDFLRYAVCYEDPNAFAPVSAVDRVTRQLSRRHP